MATVTNSPFASDVVLGVALAADRSKYQAAVERLQRLASSSEWAATQQPRAAEVVSESGSAAAGDAFASIPSPHVPAKSSRRLPSAFGQLEAFLLQTFIQAMLPKNAPQTFGKSTAGETWKSMLAEKLANEVARSGQVGLAKRLEPGSLINRVGPLNAIASAAAKPLLPALPVASLVLGRDVLAPDTRSAAIAAPGPNPPRDDGARS